MSDKNRFISGIFFRRPSQPRPRSNRPCRLTTRKDAEEGCDRADTFRGFLSTIDSSHPLRREHKQNSPNCRTVRTMYESKKGRFSNKHNEQISNGLCHLRIFRRLIPPYPYRYMYKLIHQLENYFYTLHTLGHYSHLNLPL